MGKSAGFGMGVCIAATVAAHAALLATPWGTARVSAAGRVTAAPLQVRQIAPAAVATPESRPAVPLADPAPRPSQAAAPARTSAPRLPAPPQRIEPAPAAPAPTVVSDDDLYVARSLLSVAPSALAPVVIEFPERAAAQYDRLVGQLTLFIDEGGSVVRVRAEGAPLPPELEAAARSAFMSARFAPGQMAEHGIVKSRIRVEVVFDSGRLAVPG